MEWKNIDGYRYPYRISDQGTVQRQRWDGSWKTLTPYRQGNTKNYGRLAVRMCRGPKDNTTAFVVDLMADAFLGGRRSGMVITHKNGMVTDCAVENLIFTSQRHIGARYGGAGRRCIEKIDRSRRVVGIYRSMSEAARKNFISRKSVWARCTGRVHSPFELDGYSYRYEK